MNDLMKSLSLLDFRMRLREKFGFAARKTKPDEQTSTGPEQGSALRPSDGMISVPLAAL